MIIICKGSCNKINIFIYFQKKSYNLTRIFKQLEDGNLERNRNDQLFFFFKFSIIIAQHISN